MPFAYVHLSSNHSDRCPSCDTQYYVYEDFGDTTGYTSERQALKCCAVTHCQNCISEHLDECHTAEYEQEFLEENQVKEYV